MERAGGGSKEREVGNTSSTALRQRLQNILLVSGNQVGGGKVGWRMLNK